MKAILSFLSHPRTRALRRLPAPVVWVIALAVTFAQAVAPSYAGIAISTYGSSAIVHLSVLEWSNGVPTRVAAYLPDRAEPIVSTIDPDLVRSAVWQEETTDGAWRRGRLTVAGMGTDAAYEIAYDADGPTLEAYATPEGNPEGAIHLEADEPLLVVSPRSIGIILAILGVCALISDLMQQRCLGQAKEACGAGNVKCANYTGVCGLGSCTVQCTGSPDPCN